MARHRLTPEQKAFVVVRLAAFQEPAEVRDALPAEYGLEITLQSLEEL